MGGRGVFFWIFLIFFDFGEKKVTFFLHKSFFFFFFAGGKLAVSFRFYCLTK